MCNCLFHCFLFYVIQYPANIANFISTKINYVVISSLVTRYIILFLFYNSFVPFLYFIFKTPCR
ncbi:hypothetical protein HMPREF0673_03037 [Leyella stercorea DSM 18206]|uniref:Uncharacterized protein n=1 Tax=Leyella stercorea DSM 18206 TaxID=1002367 RepID=G6B2A4_9BACT|nr:hypothetical protein HMPREF0673_03037 [Leyella stercorea DSM 18206]